MSTRQREIRRAVVERCRTPRRGRVTFEALCRETAGYVVRVRGAGVISLMARIAIRRGPLVLIVDVAIRTNHSRMRAGQRERRLTVVKRRREPGRRRMARSTVVIKVPGRMVRLENRVVLCLMTLVAICVCQLVIAPYMARLACRCDVRPGKRECR